MTVLDDAVAEIAADALRRDPVAVLDRLDVASTSATALILSTWGGASDHDMHGPVLAVPAPGVAVLGCGGCGRVVDLDQLRRRAVTDRRGRRLAVPDRITCKDCR